MLQNKDYIILVAIIIVLFLILSYIFSVGELNAWSFYFISYLLILAMGVCFLSNGTSFKITWYVDVSLIIVTLGLYFYDER